MPARLNYYYINNHSKIEADTKDLDSEVESEAEDDSEHANDDGDDDDSDNREEDGEEEVEDDEVDDVDDDTDNILLDTDPFLHHFERVLDEDVAEKLTSCSACQSEDVKWLNTSGRLQH
ncbi:hypothetical protein DPMN_101502 [Dreissena polymorpha]|uniref:Uncharacterized protein n=1 Tax=Dreissena polymorpha TaxID=45954 RepID=A0A9D4LJ20_DREPO|nr:hypothetical protein DPMN_101502 [Dreissena polymorpha]